MSSTRYSPGLYGKAPALGDFVTRRLPAHFVRPWDDWLQAALSASRGQLDSAWLDFYMISPIWRFVMSAGNCGPEAWAGILMPSVDKVNRYFPLTLAVQVQQQEILPWLFSARDDWFEKLEDLALSTLDGVMDIETLDSQLREMVVMPFLPGNDRHAGAQKIGEKEDRLGFRIAMQGLTKVRDALVHLGACMLTEFVPAYSLWCTNGSQWVQPSLLAYEGLPPPDAYAGFITGRWEHGKWGEWIASHHSTLKSDREAAASRPEDVDATGLEPDIEDLASPPGDVDSTGLNSEVEQPAAPREDMDSTLPAMAAVWRSKSATTVGCIRKVNEDSYIERTEIGLWAVADGVGGHLRGDLASKAVVTALSEIPALNSLEALTDEVRKRLREVNRQLIEMAAEYGAGQTIGSTVVIMLAFGGSCAAVWLGDSRLYRYRDGALTQITLDHSLAAELSRMGAGVETDLASTSIGNVLTKAMGASPGVEVDTLAFEALRGDLYLLCSDGMYREASDEEMAGILGKSDFEDAAQKLVDVALERGARDNVTVVTVTWIP